MGGQNPFVELRRLADWFATPSPLGLARPSLHIEKIVERLGVVCVPLLGRELCSPSEPRRDAARAALVQLATTNRSVRPRVITELRTITEGAAPDDGKVCALGLLGELGERGAAAKFHDPDAIQRASAEKLAEQLETAADIASAADLMVGKLAPDDMVSLLSIMAAAAPPRAHLLANELCARLDVAPELRDRVAEVALLADQQPETITKRAPRPTHVTVLVDGAARCVVVATRKVSGERRWRRWAVLIAGDGRIDDCLHEEHVGSDGDAATLIANLCADGYRVASNDPSRAKDLIASAARTTAGPLDEPGLPRRGSAAEWQRGVLDEPGLPRRGSAAEQRGVVDEPDLPRRGSAAEWQRGVVDEPDLPRRGSAAEWQRGVVDEPGLPRRGSAAEWQRGVVDEPDLPRRGSAAEWQRGVVDEPDLPRRGSAAEWQRGVVDEPGLPRRGSAAEWQRGVVDEPGLPRRGSAAEWQRGVVDEPDLPRRGSAAEWQRGVVDEPDLPRRGSAAEWQRGVVDEPGLPSAYYLGRDLLDLGEAHLAHRPNPTPASVGRAVELIADGEVARARLLLARCEANADVEAANAACHLAQDRTADAIACLARAIELEPAWPLHHWNLAAAAHRLADSALAYRAIRRFIATSAERTALAGDPDQPARVALATRMVAELERGARLTGVSLTPKKRRRTKR